jgi:hypothetical protein
MRLIVENMIILYFLRSVVLCHILLVIVTAPIQGCAPGFYVVVWRLALFRRSYSVNEF